MNCAFRYRGKANYRDAIFLAYGYRTLPGDNTFLHDLATASCFSFIFALALVERLLGKEYSRAFLEDLEENLRTDSDAADEAMFWTELRV